MPVVALLGWLLVPYEPLGLAGWLWVALIGSVGALAAWWLRRALPVSTDPVLARSRFTELLKPPYGKRTAVLSVFNLMQTIAFYGFGSWMPKVASAPRYQVC